MLSPDESGDFFDENKFVGSVSEFSWKNNSFLELLSNWIKLVFKFEEFITQNIQKTKDIKMNFY